ncbi:hypothetical protein WMY93_020042 [Mugilogobius chulae]|uniref:Uncharacterized protein n=1 Tax=Mugilogobius chulae TaxID=88201 RepID=A0AAW0NK81_9GOBI
MTNGAVEHPAGFRKSHQTLQTVKPIDISSHKCHSIENAERLHRLWEEEVAKVGQDKASLYQVMMRFLRAGFILSCVFGTIGMIAAFLSSVNSDTDFHLGDDARL